MHLIRTLRSPDFFRLIGARFALLLRVTDCMSVKISKMSQVDMVFGSPEALPRRSLISSFAFTPTPPRPAPIQIDRVVPCEFFSIPEDVMEIESQELLLPVSTAISLPLVSCETVASLLQGNFSDTISKFLIVDCRYDYEHNGGHIPGAISVNRHESLCELHATLLKSDLDLSRLVLIFHCEFSQNRAPKAFKAFRSLDRSANTYPTLNFPQMYIMEGGYREFYLHNKHLCMPRNYVTMTDPELSKRWKKEVVACRKSWDAKRKEKARQDEELRSPMRVSPSKRFIF